MDCYIEKLTDSLKYELKNSGFSKVVIGISGGIDSALSAAIAVKALGSDNVYGYFMPYKSSSSQSKKDAYLLKEFLKINMYDIEITPMVESFQNSLNDISPHALGNIMARCRMIILFDRSVFHNALVLGTSNKTEILLGYSTIYGDGACSINPLGDLYKTEVWEMSKALNIPKQIIEKAPSADLIKGQTDEDDIGFSYKDIDNFLQKYIEEGLDKNDIISSGIDPKLVQSISSRIERNCYKRKMPRILRLDKKNIYE